MAGWLILWGGSTAILLFFALRSGRARRRLGESERLYRSLVETASELIATVDRGGRWTFLNRDATRRLLGYQPEELLGRRFIELVVAEEVDQHLGTFSQLLAGEERSEYEATLMRKDGTRVVLSINATAFRDGAGKIVGGLATCADVTERMQATQLLEQQNQTLQRSRDLLAHSALHDALTGLPNRTLFLDRLDVALKRSERHPQRLFAVLFIDLDRFKLVNDSLGHLGGDELLKAIAGRLKRLLRPADTLARLGGDEFALLLEDLGEKAEASRIALRIQQDFATPFEVEKQEVFSSASLGIAFGSAAYSRPMELLRDADTAMYRAKAAGRSRYAVFDPTMHQRAVSQLRIESALRRALTHGQFRLHYQPIVELADGRIVGFEALLRWQHPELGLLTPDDFLAAAEEAGILPQLGEWVLAEACRQARAWQQLGPEAAELKVNVNLHVGQIVPQKLAAQVGRVLAATGLAAASLELEISEGILLQGKEIAFATLGELRALGLGVCLDDFGTGYSSLSYLPSFPVTTLKIDRSFVSDLHQGGQLAIVEAITSLAHNLGIAVVAEGLETEEQLAALRGMGCEQAQGFLLSPPLAGPDALSLLAGEAPWQERCFSSLVRR